MKVKTHVCIRQKGKIVDPESTVEIADEAGQSLIDRGFASLISKSTSKKAKSKPAGSKSDPPETKEPPTSDAK